VMDDNKKAEKWEHLEELLLWMKHVLGLMSDIVNNGLGQAFFLRILLFWIVSNLLFCWCAYCLGLFLQDLKETSRLKSGFIHATMDGWE